MHTISETLFNSVSLSIINVSMALIVSVLIISFKQTASQASQQLHCTDKEFLFPCVCNERGYNKLEIDCTDVRTEEELKNVFNNPLNVTTFWKFVLQEESRIRRLEKNDFGNSTFLIIDIHSDLEYLGQHVFENSYNVLEVMDVSDNNIRVHFLFESMEHYSKLEILDMSYNELPGTIPPIYNPSLKEMDFSDNYLTSIWDWTFNYVAALEEISVENNFLSRISTRTFESLENLTEINLGRNLLPNIPKRTLSELPKLSTLDISNNEIKYIDPEAFIGTEALKTLHLDHNELSTASSFIRNLPGLQSLYLNNNKITSIESDLFVNLNNPTSFQVDLSYNLLETIEPDAFKGIQKYAVNLDYNKLTSIANGSFPDMNGSSLFLGYNNITTLDEYWLRPLFEANVGVKLDGNPLECGCDIAWIFQFPNDIKNFYGYPICGNGTTFDDLDQEYYLINC